MPGPEYAIVGLIRKAQGIRGEVVVEPLTDKPDVVFASGSRVFAGTTDGELAIARDVRGEEEIPTLTNRIVTAPSCGAAGIFSLRSASCHRSRTMRSTSTI
jgi:ribosomal 30S subunit maturation factor RimM